jgi:hypothetical protein
MWYSSPTPLWTPSAHTLAQAKSLLFALAMVHLFSISLLAILAGLTSANPLPEQDVLVQPVHTMAGWSWKDCGETYFDIKYQPLAKLPSGLPTDAIQLQSISLSPDPPKPGEDLTVTAVGLAQEVIEVGFVIVACRLHQVYFCRTEPTPMLL